jgi:hypothetical protein
MIRALSLLNAPTKQQCRQAYIHPLGEDRFERRRWTARFLLDPGQGDDTDARALADPVRRLVRRCWPSLQRKCLLPGPLRHLPRARYQPRRGPGSWS